MVNNKNWIIALILIGGIILLSQIEGPEKETIYDRDTMEECEEKRQHRISEGWQCVGECKLLEPIHKGCNAIDDDEIGKYAFFGDEGACENMHMRDQNNWICFYEDNPDICLDTSWWYCGTIDRFSAILYNSCGEQLQDCAASGDVCGKNEYGWFDCISPTTATTTTLPVNETNTTTTTTQPPATSGGGGGGSSPTTTTTTTTLQTEDEKEDERGFITPLLILLALGGLGFYLYTKRK